MSKKRKRSRAATTWAERDWYDIRAEADSAEVLIYDRIGEGFFTEGVTAKDFITTLQSLKVATLSVRINSPGGSVFDGLAIHNALRAHPAEVTTHVDGLAASIASVIALAGDEVRTADNALMMIHNPMSMAIGTAEELRQEADILDKISGAMVAIYTESSDLDADEVTAALQAETWYSAAEARDAGFIDHIDGASKAAAEYTDDLPTFARTVPAVAVAQPPEGSTMTTKLTQRYATHDELSELESRLAAMSRPADPPRRLGVTEALAEQLRAGKETRRVAALADVLSSGNAGVLPPQWSKEVRDYVDRQRYMFSALGSIGFPTVGTSLTVPKITGHTLVGPRGGEKTEIPSRTFTTGSDTFSVKFFAGGADIALEVIWQSDPAIYPLVVESILGQYAVATDEALTADVEDEAVATGAALDLTDYGTFISDVMGQAEAIRAATGEWGDQLALTTASWQAVLGLLDGDGRRALAPVGATNADGSAAILSRGFNLGGVQVMHNPRLSVDIQFNTKSARVGEKPPVTLTQDTVALMGRDIGVLGGYIFAPMYADGLVKYAVAG